MWAGNVCVLQESREFAPEIVAKKSKFGKPLSLIAMGDDDGADNDDNNTIRYSCTDCATSPLCLWFSSFFCFIFGARLIDFIIKVLMPLLVFIVVISVEQTLHSARKTSKPQSLHKTCAKTNSNNNNNNNNQCKRHLRSRSSSRRCRCFVGARAVQQSRH